jgi:hypothetical protein
LSSEDESKKSFAAMAMAMALGPLTTTISGHPKLASALFGFEGGASRPHSRNGKLNCRQRGVSTTAQAGRQRDYGGEWISWFLFYGSRRICAALCVLSFLFITWMLSLEIGSIFSYRV